MECLPTFTRNLYKSDFHIADTGFYSGQVAATTTKRNVYWRHWTAYVTPLGLDPLLRDVAHAHQIRALTGFAGRVRTGFYGRGRQITAPVVNSALTAVGTAIALATGTNPTKMQGAQDKLVPRISQMLEGFGKTDPPTMKKLPIGIDIPEYISVCSLRPAASTHNKAVADLILIAFYFLLRVGKYTVKGAKTSTKQTVQFRLQDTTFFAHDTLGRLHQLPQNAPLHVILEAHSVTLKLDNQKNGWKGVCIHQECNGDMYHCPVRALGRRFVRIRENTSDLSTFLSAYFPTTGNKRDVTDKDISTMLKLAAVALKYPALRGIPIDQIDTHSLRSGGANALALNGYSDREIQKMGRWRSQTFKYILEKSLTPSPRGCPKR